MEIVADCIKNPEKHTTGNKVLVIPLEPGGGKSRITNKVLAELALTDIRQSGTILLKQRIEDCKSAVAAINNIAGKEVSQCYYGSMFTDKEKYYSAKETDYLLNLYRYPILVMTHELFKMRYKRLNDFVLWLDPDVSERCGDIVKLISDAREFGINLKYQKRDRLIIDEQPQPIKIIRLTMQKLSALEGFIQRSGNKQFVNEVLYVTQYIKINCFIRRTDLTLQYWDRLKFTFSNGVIQYFKRHGKAKFDADDSIHDLFTGLGLFCSDGGFVSYSDNEKYRHVLVAVYADIFHPIFRKVILDGTARINYIYENTEKFELKDIPRIKTYANTTLDISKQFTGTRNELRGSEYIIPRLREFIIKKAGSHRTLIVTCKEFESRFIDLGLPKNILIDHYGNITGTNKYIDCDYLFLVGINYLYDDAYKVCYHVFYNGSVVDKNQNTISKGGVHCFADEDYNKMRNSAVTCEIVQAMNRGSCRKIQNGDTPETYIFLLNRDQGIIDLIKKAMPGINIVSNMDFYETVPVEERKPRQQPSIDALMHVLNGIPGHNVVSKADILALNDHLKTLKKSQKTNLWNDPAIRQMEAEGKIRVHHKVVEFVG